MFNLLLSNAELLMEQCGIS